MRIGQQSLGYYAKVNSSSKTWHKVRYPNLSLSVCGRQLALSTLKAIDAFAGEKPNGDGERVCVSC